MKTYECLFLIYECEMVISLRATNWQSVEDAAEKIARSLGATYSHSIEKGEEA